MSDAVTILSDETLMEIVRASPDEALAMPAVLDELRLAQRLIRPFRLRQDGCLEHAMTLLASALGRMSKYNPTHLPFGHQGPTITSSGWLDRDDLELIAKQIVGLTWPDSKPDEVDVVVGRAVSKAVALGLVEEREDDAWRPGMASGSGWRPKVSATAYGIAKARALAQSTLGGHGVGPKEGTPAAQEAATMKTDDGRRAENAADACASPVEGAPRDDGPSTTHSGCTGGANPREYRARLLSLMKVREVPNAGASCPACLIPGVNTTLSVEQAASMIAADLDLWVEAVADAEADSHPQGGYWSTLDTDLEDRLGPAELATGMFEDAWTALLAGLLMRGHSELVQRLERLAKEVVPKATQLARDMDAVAYLTQGGPKDALYEVYAREDLVAYEGSLFLGRRDVLRDVKTIVGILRALLPGHATGSSPETKATGAEGVGGAAGPEPQSKPSRTVNLSAPSAACYAELAASSRDEGVLRVLFTKTGPGRPTEVGSVPIRDQPLKILLAGIETALRRIREEAERLPTDRLPEECKITLEWSADSLRDYVQGEASARRKAMNRLRSLVRFQDGAGLVSDQDGESGTWRSTIPFRFQTSGQL